MINFLEENLLELCEPKCLYEKISFKHGLLLYGLLKQVSQSDNHRCRKFFTFWERGKTLRKFLQEVRLFGVSRSKKRLIIAENILNMEKFD